MVESRRFSLRVPLPAAAGWTVDDARERWLLLRHPATNSELRLRTWSAPRLVRREDCAEQVRLWRGALPDPSTILQQRELASPPGYGSQLTLSVHDVDGGLRGQALVFGATIGRCYAALYHTHARGIGAEAVIAERLSFVVEDVLSRVDTLTVDDRGRNSRAPLQ